MAAFLFAALSFLLLVGFRVVFFPFLDIARCLPRSCEVYVPLYVLGLFM